LKIRGEKIEELEKKKTANSVVTIRTYALSGQKGDVGGALNGEHEQAGGDT